MNRIFVTGDKHCDFVSRNDYLAVQKLCETAETTKDDVLIVLGDHGIHYDNGTNDHNARRRLSEFPITFVMIRGNHDMRPNVDWRTECISNGAMSGYFVRDPEVDNILYTTEWGWYIFGDMPAFVIGGAYSVDKYYRLEKQKQGNLNYRWFADEQLNLAERRTAFTELITSPFVKEPFLILSHTCPLGFKPQTGLLPGVDQSTVDTTMEEYLDNIYVTLNDVRAPLARWYCGHWHIDETNEPIRFMYHDIEELKGTEPWRRVSTIQTIKQHSSLQTSTNG